MRKTVFFIIAIILFFLNLNPLFAQEYTVCEGPVQLISENLSGSLIAISDSSCVNIYDTKDFSLVCRFYDENVCKTAFYSEGDAEFISVMTKNGQFIVRKLLFYDDVWHCEEGEPYFSADCADASGRKALTALSFSNNSDYVAAAFSDNTVQVHFRLRVTAGSISHTITSHKSQVYGLEFSKNGEYLASVSTDGEAYIWNSYTSSKITHLNGIYTRARVPVCFTEDSVYIVSLDGRNSFRISDFSGNTLYSILTGRPITAIRPLKDPDLLAIRNDKDEVMIYSISSRRPLSVSSVKEDAAFTAFEFTAQSELMYAGLSDGRLVLVEPQPYLDETSMLVTDSTLAGNGKGMGKLFGGGAANPFQGLSFSAGANYLNKPYLLSANFRTEYFYSEAISPFIVGGGLSLSFGFPRQDFPATYKIHGQQVASPNLLSATIYVPAGYSIAPWNNDLLIFTTAKAGAKMTCIALFANGKSVVGNPAFSFFMSVGAGMQIKWFTFDINCEYDTIGKVSPSIYAGYILKWGGQK